MGNAARQVAVVVGLLEMLTYDRLHDLEKITRLVLLDGMRGREYQPTSSGGGGSAVESTALFGLNEDNSDDWSRHNLPDPMGDEARGAFTDLEELSKLAQRIIYRLGFIEHAAEIRGRQSSLAGECQRCHRPVAGTTADPFRHAYCGACAQAWYRAGRPDRFAFESEWARVEGQVGQASSTEWDNGRNFTIGPADGVDRRDGVA